MQASFLEGGFVMDRFRSIVSDIVFTWRLLCLSCATSGIVGSTGTISSDILQERVMHAAQWRNRNLLMNIDRDSAQE